MKFFRYLFLLALSLFLAPAFCQGQGSDLDALDTDSDGKVTKAEFQEYAEGRMPDFDQVEKFADLVDADKDGAISEDEFADRMEVLQDLIDGVGEEKKELTEEEQKMADEATKAYDAIAKSVSQGDWEEAAERMTKQARDDYVVGIVGQSIMLTKMNIPPQLRLDDVKEAIIGVTDKYGLSDIDVSAMRPQRGGGRPNNDDKKDDDEKMSPLEKMKAEIIAAIDENDQRWEIFSAIQKARKGSPLESDVFGGKVSGSDVEDGTVFLTLTREGGNQRAIPSVVKMTAVDDKWQYNGIDQARSRRAVQRMLRGTRGQQRESDF